MISPWGKGGRIAALAVIAAMLLTGCVPGQGDETPVDASLYMGPLPAPAQLPVPPDLPPLPQAPADPGDASARNAYNAAMNAYSTAMQANQDKVTAQIKAVKDLAKDIRAGGKGAVAAWEALLVTAGMAVNGADGKPIELNGSSGSGWPMTDAELRLHSMLAASSGGVRLSDLAHTLGAIPGLDYPELTAQLYRSLQVIPDHGFGVVFWAVGPGLSKDGKLVTPDDMVLSWAQVELLLRRMSAEFAVYGTNGLAATPSGLGSDPGASSSDASVAIAPAALITGAAPKRPCENRENPWSQELVHQTQQGMSSLFGWAIGKAVEAAEANGATTGTKVITGAGTVIGLAGIFASFATLYAQAASLRATFSMSNSPLVRTKKMTPGEVRDLTVTLSYDPSAWGKISECLNLAFNFAGISIPSSPVGVPTDLNVELYSTDPSVLRVGDGKGGDTPVYKGTTDSRGEAKFKLSGAPQADRIPDKAQPKDLSIEVKATTDLKGSNLFKDLAALPWDAMSFLGSFGTSLIPELLSRTNFLTFKSSIPVRDWDLSAQFEASAKGKIVVHRATNVDWQGCGGYSIINRSTDAESTFTTTKTAVTAALVSNDFGNVGDQAFVFYPKGETFTAIDLGNGDGLKMFGLLAAYSTDKTTAEPATGDQPERKMEDCIGAGSGGGLHSDPQPQDCGVRTYAMDVNVTMPSARHLFVPGQPSNESGLWKNCGDPLVPFDPTVAPTMQSCAAPQAKDGKVPSIDEIFDPSKTKFTISGSYSCIQDEPGQLNQVYYNWTLTLCRVVDGKAKC